MSTREETAPLLVGEQVAAYALAIRAEVVAPLLALHPKTPNPTHGCCAPPKLCRGHAPECRSNEHPIGGKVPWPCRTLRAVGITSDDDAEAVLRLVTRPARETTNPAAEEASTDA